MAKKSVCVFVCITFFASLLVLPVTVSAGAINSVENPGFETGDLTGWFVSSVGINAEGSSSVITGDVHSGDYAFKQSGRIAKYHGIIQDLSINMDRTYIYSVWFKVGENDAGKNAFRFMDDQDPWRAMPGNSLPGTTEWQNLTFEHKIPEAGVLPENIDENGNYNLRLLFLEAYDPGAVYQISDTVYIDDFSVTPVYVLTSVDVTGIDTVIQPASGSTSNFSYAAVAKNQNGNTTEMPTKATWFLQDEVRGASINPTTGVLTLTDEIEAGASITLVAAITDMGVTKSGTKSLTVLENIPDDVKLQRAADAIVLSGNTGNLTNNLVLPTAGEYGTVISWSSSHPAVISTTGELTVAAVLSPVTVTLTATISISGAEPTVNKIFKFTVLPNSNLIKNPGFENPLGSEWYLSGADSTTSIMRVDNTAHSGNYSLKTTGMFEGWPRMQQVITVNTDVEYAYSFWIKVPEGQGAGTYDLRRQILNKELYVTVIPPRTITEADGWVRMSGKYTEKGEPGQGSTTDICLFVRVGSNHQYYIDDVYVGANVIESVTVSGLTQFRLPSAGGETVTKEYTLAMNDILGEPLPKENTVVIWDAVDAATREPIDGVTVSGNDEKAVLSVKGSVPKNTEVALVASATWNDSTITGEKHVTLLEYLDEQSAAQNALNDISWFNLSDESIDNIKKSITMPSSFTNVSMVPNYTVNFSWESSNPNALKINVDQATGVITGIVTQSEFFEQHIALTVTATLGEITASKTFNVTVAQLVNFMEHGDFENGDTEGWTTTGTATVTATAAAAKTGSFGGLVENRTTPADKAVYATPQLKQDRAYYICGFVKAVNGLDTAAVSLMRGKNETVVVQKAINNLTFTEIGEVFVYNQLGSDISQISIVTASANDYYIDDFSLRDITNDLQITAEAVVKAEKTRLAADIASGIELVSILPDCERKTLLGARLNNITTTLPGSHGGNSGSSGGGGNTTISVNTSPAPPIAQAQAQAQAQTQTTVFGDIENHWAKTDIEFLALKGIVSGAGDGQFLPENSVTRAEFAKMTLNAIGMLLTPYHDSFDDVSGSDWYASVVQTIADNGLMLGYEHYFRPNDKITREEMAKIIIAAYEYHTQATVSDLSAIYFDDADDISDWAVGSIQKAVKMRFVNGITATEFAPKEFSTRAQAAAIIKRLCDSIEE